MLVIILRPQESRGQNHGGRSGLVGLQDDCFKQCQTELKADTYATSAAKLEGS